MDNTTTSTGLQGAVSAASPGEGKDIDPRLKAEMDNYVTSIMYVMHNPKTADSVVNMLAAAPPEQSIPETALYLNGMVEKSFASKRSAPVSTEVKLAGAAYAVADLAELGNVSGVWDKEVAQEEIQPLLSSTVKKYVKKGLADKTIDPIQLQKETESLLTDEQKQMGLSFAEGLGMPAEPTAGMAMDTYAQKKTAPLQEENAQLKSLIQQQKQAEMQQQQSKQGGSPYGL